MFSKIKIIFLCAITAMVSLTGCSFFSKQNESKGSNSEITYNPDNYLFVLNNDKQSYSVTMGAQMPKGDFHIPSTYKKLPVTKVKENAFSYCDYITSLTFHGNVETIENNAFNSCYHIKKITFCSSIRIIGDGAFSNNGELLYVDCIDGDLDDWYQNVVSIGNDNFELINAIENHRKDNSTRNNFYLDISSYDSVPNYVDLYLLSDLTAWECDGRTLLIATQEDRTFFAQKVHSAELGDYRCSLVAQYHGEKPNNDHVIIPSGYIHVTEEVCEGYHIPVIYHCFQDGYIRFQHLDIDWNAWMPPRS